jgi:predicted O-methyltransferase YrrM
MPLNALTFPHTDPTPIFEHFRGNFAAELLTAAVAHLHVFDRLADGPLPWDVLRERLGLAERPMNVLLTALRAMGLVVSDSAGRQSLSAIAREHLMPGGSFDVSDYVGLAADAPAVREIVQRLIANRPAGVTAEDESTPWIYKEGAASAMDKAGTARHFTLALAGRAKNVAPYLAARVPLDSAKLLVDVGGGTGIYAIACLQQNLRLRAIVWDRPEVLKIASEMADAYGVADRLECRSGDMFHDAIPAGADAVLLSNILHDWDALECSQLIARLAAALPLGGRLLIHDAFLNDALDGPLPIALYSAALFCVTEGRAYSASEYRGWLEAAGLETQEIIPTLVHCGVLTGVKR